MDLMDWIKLMLLLFNIYTPVSHQNGISRSASIQAKVAILFMIGKDFSFVKRANLQKTKEKTLLSDKAAGDPPKDNPGEPWRGRL